MSNTKFIGKLLKDRYIKKLTYKNIDMIIQQATDLTDEDTHQSMEAVVHNLNSMHSRAGSQVPFSSLNFGTDTSVEGRMVTKNLLYAIDEGLGYGETAIFPVAIFKEKELMDSDCGMNLKQRTIDISI